MIHLEVILNITWGGWSNFVLLKIDIHLPQDCILIRLYFLSSTCLEILDQNELTGLEKSLFLDAEFNSIEPSIYLDAETIFS